MSFPKHANYRDCGIPWIGTIPTHWKVMPLVGVASERSEPNVGMQENNLLSLSYGRIVRKDIDSNDGLLPESFETYQVIRAGDIVLRLTDLQNDKRSLRSALVDERGIITSAYLALNPTRVGPDFLAYLLRAYDLTKVFYSMGGGLRQSMKFADMKRLPVLLPPDDEQSAIVVFLDRETAKIDALIEEQKRLIELLKEKRQAVISQAVTKGLDPDVPMKDSGVEWLGEVPAHWITGTLRWYARCSSGAGIASDSVEDSRSEEHSVPVIGGNGLMGFAHQASLDRMVLAVGRVGALCGNVHIVPPPSWVTDNALVVRPDNEHFRLPYIAAVLRARGLNDIAAKTAQPLITGTQVMGQRVPIPPLSEQDEIVRLIDEHAMRCDALIAEAESGTCLLQERRSALISAAVTGKIDVRSLATRQRVAA